MLALGELLMVAAGLFWASVALTLVCVFFYPRTVFGNLLLGAAAVVIGFVFAAESKSQTAMLAVLVIGLLPYVWLIVRGISRYRSRANAVIWQGAGMSGAFYLWQSVEISGQRARRFWLMQVLCSSLLAATLA